MRLSRLSPRVGTSFFALTALVCAASAQSFTRISDVVYLKQGGAAFTFDVFKPKKANGACIIQIVSGGWVSDHQGIDPNLAEAATSRGFTMVQVVHGAQPRYKVPEIIGQITRAIRFVRANASTYGIDPNRLGVSGGSAGGHLSLMLAARGAAGDPAAKDPVDRESSKLQAVGIFFPPTDFMNYGKDGSVAFENPLLRSAFGNAFVADVNYAKPEQIREISVAMSPINGFTAAMPPTLIVHGDADTLVPIQQSQIAIKKLEGLGVPCKLITVPGKGHGWPEMPTQYQEILNWFEKYLK